MAVVTDDPIHRSRNCTVNKFVIVGVLFDDSETIERLDFLDKWMNRKELHHVLSHFYTVFTSQYFPVFQEYLRRDAHGQLAIDNAVENPTIRRGQANHGDQHIGVNDYP